MANFDWKQLEADRAAGTPGPFQADGHYMHDCHPIRVSTPDVHGVPGPFIAQCGHDWEEERISWKQAEANAARFARVPDLEAYALEARAKLEAAEAMAEALTQADEAITREINPSNYSHDDVCRLNDEAMEAVSIVQAALAAWNAAQEGGDA